MCRASILLFSIILLFSCRSVTFPEPQREESSLLIIQVENQTAIPRTLVFRQGLFPRSFRIKAHRERTISLVTQGNQSLILLNRRASDQRLELYPSSGSVELWPNKILISRSGISLQDISPEDRYSASQALLDQFGFYHWASYPAENFSPYMPRRFHGNRLGISVDSDIPAQVWIDGVFWGTTPVSTMIPPGRHQLIYRDDSRELYRCFIDVEAPGHFFHSLEDLEESPPEVFRLVMAPFQPWSEEPDPFGLGFLLQDSLVQALKEIPSIELLLWDPSGPYDTPMDHALEKGAELLLEGFYWTFEDELFIQSRLLDVRTNQLRDSSPYQSELGLDILTNIHEAAQEITYSLHRVLPEDGGSYYVLQDDLTASLMEVEKLLALEYIGELRMDRPNHIFGGMALLFWTPTLTLNDGTEITHQGYAGPCIAYERDFSSRVSLRSTLGIMPLFYYEENLGSGSAPVYIIDMKMLYKISTTEQFLRYGGLGASLKYKGDDNTGNFSFISLSPHFAIGSRIYLSNRISGHRRFWDLGAQVPFLPYTFSSQGDVTDNDLIHFHILYGVDIR